MTGRATAALGLTAAVALLAAALPSAGPFLRPAGGAGGAGAAGLTAAGGPAEAPVTAVERRDFVHLVPAEGNFRAARSTPLAVPVAVSGPFHVGWVAPEGSLVRAGDVVVRFDPAELESLLSDAEGDLASARLKAGKQRSSDLSEIDKLERDAAMARLELANAGQFLKKDELIFSRHDIITSEIDQQLAADKERHAREQRGTRAQLGRADLSLLAIDVRQAELKIVRARSGLSALQVKAPHDGVLMLRRNNGPGGEPPRVGDTVWSGTPLAEIPDLSVMLAEVYVLEADAGGLAAGKPATLPAGDEARPAGDGRAASGGAPRGAGGAAPGALRAGRAPRRLPPARRRRLRSGAGGAGPWRRRRRRGPGGRRRRRSGGAARSRPRAGGAAGRRRGAGRPGAPGGGGTTPMNPR